MPQAADVWLSDINPSITVTPDGTRIVYVGNDGAQLFVRALDTLDPVAIVTGRPRTPFVSPDGQWVGFFDSNELRKVPITGGPSIVIATTDLASRGAAWTPDDTIVFATGNPAIGLQRVSARGGTAEVLTRPDRARGEGAHVWPELLPGGRAVLFTITAAAGGLDSAQVAVQDLQTNAQTILVRGGSHAKYVSSGHLVYTSGGALRAVPFNLSGRVVSGTSIPVVQRLATTQTGGGQFSLTADGTLVYVDLGGRVQARTLTWVDRTGNEEKLTAPPRFYVQPRVSPDGTKVALYINDQERDIWIWDLQRATLTRLTTDSSNDLYPVWSSDNRRIIFASSRDGIGIWSQAADGTGVAERLNASKNRQVPFAVAPDGSLVFGDLGGTMASADIMRDTLNADHRSTPLVQSKFDERNGIVSPNGRWLAYDSDSSGRHEVYVTSFPNVGSGQLVSTAGGWKPLWAPNGKELFYETLDRTLMRVAVDTNSPTWNAGAPIKLFDSSRRYFLGGDSSTGRTYDVSPDGQRFLMIKLPGDEPVAMPPSLIVVQNWVEDLKRLVPVN